MNNNFLINDRLVDNKLASLRAEGMRSQMIARANRENHKNHFPDLRRIFQRMLVRVTGLSLRRINRPATKMAAERI